MAWITPTALAISAAAGLGSAAINASRSQAAPQQNQALQYEALQMEANNQQNQALVQALINQRGVAGQTDSFGNQIQYDPATNTWRTTLGPLPLAAQTAAQQAAISRNTTDLRAAQFANQQAALRASMAEPGADAAQRDLATFRPMTADALTGLLQQQATNAQQATFRPMIADTLRSFARTGTAAGPVLGQIGRDEAQNLRNSLIDAQIKGMTGVGDINTQREQMLGSRATTAAGLASPQLQFSGLSGSGGDNTLAQLVAARAQGSSTSPAYGMAGANAASGQLSSSFSNLGKNLSDPNFGLSQAGSITNDLSTSFGPGGAINALIKQLSGPSTNSGDFTSDMQPAISGTNTQSYFPADQTMTAAPSNYYAGGVGGGGY
jgi:hypothetical protein